MKVAVCMNTLIAPIRCFLSSGAGDHGWLFQIDPMYVQPAVSWVRSQCQGGIVFGAISVRQAFRRPLLSLHMIPNALMSDSLTASVVTRTDLCAPRTPCWCFILITVLVIM
ncbi:unnamed protein product [Cercospora beticola]|nr:unnamed protein product [Cercospora beticola]